LNEVINDIENHHYYLTYEPDKTEGYTNGTIDIYLEPKGSEYHHAANHSYIITLRNYERMWDYCECQPEDEGYNPIHNCCGNGCDWYAPAISIEKHENVAYFSFNGAEKDIWELRSKWSGNEEELKQKQFQEEMVRLDRQIEEIMERKRLLMAEEED
jgi:hypothetical protein